MFTPPTVFLTGTAAEVIAVRVDGQVIGEGKAGQIRTLTEGIRKIVTVRGVKVYE